MLNTPPPTHPSLFHIWGSGFGSYLGPPYFLNHDGIRKPQLVRQRLPQLHLPAQLTAEPNLKQQTLDLEIRTLNLNLKPQTSNLKPK